MDLKQLSFEELLVKYNEYVCSIIKNINEEQAFEIIRYNHAILLKWDEANGSN